MRACTVRRLILLGVTVSALTSWGCRSSPTRSQAVHRQAAPTVAKPPAAKIPFEANDTATDENHTATSALSQSARTHSASPKIVQASRQSEAPAARRDADAPKQPLFEIPRELPGADAAPLNLPPIDPNESAESRAAKINRLYRPLSSVRPAETLADQTEWNLAALQTLAWERNPAVQAAESRWEAARGAMIQAGLHPNPLVAYEADTVRTLGTRGYQGVQVTQQVVTGGKLGLAQSAAAMDFHNAGLDVQKVRADVATKVRDAYYDYLIAQERLRLQRALARFTDNIYRAHIEQAKGGQAAPFEPLQLRIFGVQARNAVMTAENDATAAWRRLASGLGDSERPTLRVVGDVTRSPSALNFEQARAFVLQYHTDLRSAQNLISQARLQTELELKKPRCPDLFVYSAIQHDYTGMPFNTTYNVQVGAPLPLFDRNQGNILRAQSTIAANDRAFATRQTELTARLADAISRYQTARQLSESYRDEVLPDQVRVYRGVYARYQQDREAVTFTDVVVAQQSLSTAVSNYTDALSNLWQAYVDLAGLLQLEDASQLEQICGAADDPADAVPPAP